MILTGKNRGSILKETRFITEGAGGIPSKLNRCVLAERNLEAEEKCRNALSLTRELDHQLRPKRERGFLEC